jgi:hypothetical protein
MSQETKQTEENKESKQFIPPTLIERPQTDFEPLLQLGRPGGVKDGKAAAADIQFFKESKTGKRWVGKCGLNAMTRPAYLRQTQQGYEAQYKRGRYFDEYREAVALLLYQTVGVVTPTVAISIQKPATPSVEDHRTLSDMLDYDKPCLHLMTEFCEGFQVLGKPFISAYQQRHDLSAPTTVTTPDGETLILKGHGAALAVGCFLLDADCVGGGGTNMGYVVKTDSNTKRYAQLVKIDAGAGFAFLDGDEGVFVHDPRTRDMFFAKQNDFILTYAQLSAPDQVEFAQMARHIG